VHIPAKVTIDDYQIGALKHELFGRPTVVKNRCKALLSGSPVVPTHCARLSCPSATAMSRMKFVSRSTKPAIICSRVRLDPALFAHGPGLKVNGCQDRFLPVRLAPSTQRLGTLTPL
jgi:hypothetical protein